MKKIIEISRNKNLRLENVLIKEFIDFSSLIEENHCGEISLNLEVEKMENEIKVRGANQVGPLIQYSEMEKGQEDPQIKIKLMLQSDCFITNIKHPYEMQSVIQVKNCMYTRFIGSEEKLYLAYQKIEIDAYENDIKLKGSSYTIFLDSKEDGMIVADRFMEKYND